MTTDLVPPHDIETERALLGVLVLSAPAWHAVAGTVTGTDFYRDAHHRLWNAVEALHDRRTAVDLVTVVSELQSNGNLEEVGGPRYVAGLLDAGGFSANAASYAKIVREKSLLRRIIADTGRVAKAAYEGASESGALVQEAMRRLAEIPILGVRTSVTAEEAVFQYTTALDLGQVLPPIRTGYVDFDALTGGVRPRTLTLVAARPSVGKTTFALGAAEYMARHGSPTAFFPIEMTLEETAAQLLAWRTHVPTATFEHGVATDEDYARIGAAIPWFTGLPLHIVDSCRSFSDVASWSRRLVDLHGVKVVVVDYLQKLLPDERGRSEQEEIAAQSNASKRLAQDLGVAMVMLCQLGRGSEERRDKRPHLSDLRGSGALEQDADLAALLFREEMHRPKPENAGVAEVIVEKNRRGPVGLVRLAFQKDLARFANLAHEP